MNQGSCLFRRSQESSACLLLVPLGSAPLRLVQGGLFADNLPCKQDSGGDAREQLLSVQESSSVVCKVNGL